MRQEIMGRENLCGTRHIQHHFGPKVQARKAAFLRKHGLIHGVGAEVAKADAIWGLLQQSWKKPYPIMLDKAEALQAKAMGKTVLGVPFKEVLERGVVDGKVQLADDGERIFLLREIILRRSPSSSSGREEIMGAFVGEEELALGMEGQSERAALARRTSSGYNSAWAHIRGEERQIAREALEELRERAKAGDERARRALEKLSKTRVDGDDEGVLTPQFMKTVEKIRPAERRELGKLAAIKQRANEGDTSAQAKVRQIKKMVGDLVDKAKGGDVSAARAVQILEESGLFSRSQPAKL